MLNGEMPKVAGKKDSTPEILSLLWDLTCSQILGMYMECEPRPWNPALHNYFFSMETVLVLFFYRTDGVIVLVVPLLQHLPWKGRHEFNAFLMDIHIFICGESILITGAQISCSRGANALVRPISRMKCKIIQSEKHLGKGTCL